VTRFGCHGAVLEDGVDLKWDRCCWLSFLRMVQRWQSDWRKMHWESIEPQVSLGKVLVCVVVISQHLSSEAVPKIK
jgi:hypothetical protein